MNKSVINSAESYRLLIEGELLRLIREVIELEIQHEKTKAYRKRRDRLENKLYDLYEQVGWSVVYQLKQSPF